jgi:hypothetical protein
MRMTFQTRVWAVVEMGFAEKNGTDVMKYVDNYISPQLNETAVNQTNLHAQQIVTMP